MIDPIRALLEKARRYVRSAELLRASGDYDSAASRLYYAMFYCAEALLASKGLTYSSHAAVIAKFGEHFAKTGELPADMHRWLREAFDRRQQADYREERGHANALEDMLATKRLGDQKRGSCMTCKSSQVPGLMSQLGADRFYATPVKELVEQHGVVHSISCVDCHRATIAGTFLDVDRDASRCAERHPTTGHAL